MTTKVTRKQTVSVLVKEKITPDAGKPFTIPHTLKINGDGNGTVDGALVHSGVANGTINLNALVHPSGATRNYNGKKLTRMSVYCNHAAKTVITSSYFSDTFVVLGSGFLIVPFDIATLIDDDTITFTNTASFGEQTVTVILEFV